MGHSTIHRAIQCMCMYVYSIHVHTHVHVHLHVYLTLSLTLLPGLFAFSRNSSREPEVMCSVMNTSWMSHDGHTTSHDEHVHAQSCNIHISVSEKVTHRDGDLHVHVYVHMQTLTLSWLRTWSCQKSMNLTMLGCYGNRNCMHSTVHACIYIVHVDVHVDVE